MKFGGDRLSFFTSVLLSVFENLIYLWTMCSNFLCVLKSIEIIWKFCSFCTIFHLICLLMVSSFCWSASLCNYGYILAPCISVPYACNYIALFLNLSQNCIYVRKYWFTVWVCALLCLCALFIYSIEQFNDIILNLHCLFTFSLQRPLTICTLKFSV